MSSYWHHLANALDDLAAQPFLDALQQLDVEYDRALEWLSRDAARPLPVSTPEGLIWPVEDLERELRGDDRHD